MHILLYHEILSNWNSPKITLMIKANKNSIKITSEKVSKAKWHTNLMGGDTWWFELFI